ncbi:hypothetical protein [Marinobacter sp.]|uniref:hypothetical protein n=1 Tax=Marinobacter sp. TaxID=50741 RepID=UPI003A9442C2
MLLKSSFAAVTVMVSAFASAVELPHTFAAGEAASAAEVNANFEALAQATTAASATKFGPEYVLRASASGAPGSRNVIVLKQDMGDGDSCNHKYRFRVFFDNTEEESVETPNGIEQPDKIWIDGQVCASRDNPTVADWYRTSWIAHKNLSDDPNNVTSEAYASETSDSNSNHSVEGYRETKTSNPLAGSELIQSVIIWSDENGQIDRTYNFSSIVTSYGKPLTIVAPVDRTFNDVMMQSFFSGNLRLRAKNVGMVLESKPGEIEPAKAIYYRIDGQAVGDLANTPFADGVLSSGWFTQ